MAPGIYHLPIYCGTTLDADALYFLFQSPSGAAIDLTGCSAQAQARSDDGTVLFDLRSADGGITLGGADGRISLCLSAAQTAALWRPGLAPYSGNRSADLYVAGRWDLELTDATGRVTRLLQGKLLLSPEVTYA